MGLAAVVLAAGKGTRMKSKQPKVLHKVCGKAMISHVIDAVAKAGVEKNVVVVGYKGEDVEKEIGKQVITVSQREQLGTAHALLQAGPVLEGFDGHILVVCGDTPLITAVTLKSLVSETIESRAAAAVLTTVLEDPEGYGRVVRDQNGDVAKIVEQKDAGPSELAVREINTGIYCFAAGGLFDALAALDTDNAQGEYYLTDIVELYKSRGQKVIASSNAQPWEIIGVNDRRQLANVEKIMRRGLLDQLMFSGVTIIDPDSTYVDSGVEIGKDTVLYPFTIIEGETVIGENCLVGPAARLVNAGLGNGSKVEQSTINGSVLGEDCVVGPFSYIRPGCIIADRVKVGDFVELKKVSLGKDSKVPHLTYLGDAKVGKNVNVGAGTITCNYDGQNKFQTSIGDGAFIGSNTSLVAPVLIGEQAVVGAGSTITKNVPARGLGVARGKQKVYDEWKGRKGD